ncbi:MAG: hypothetical protein QM763_10980 [Agriterribacter sp.]
MKKVSLLLVFVAFFAAAAFANTSVFNKNFTSEKSFVTTYQKGSVTFEVISIENELIKAYTCTVTASWKNSDGTTSSVTITNNCGNCTSQQQACDGAYKVASIIIPD